MGPNEVTLKNLEKDCYVPGGVQKVGVEICAFKGACLLGCPRKLGSKVRISRLYLQFTPPFLSKL